MDDYKITPEIEAGFKERKIKDKDIYEYSSGNFITLLPEDTHEILRESEAQSAEDLPYNIKNHADGTCTLVFMRHKDTPDTPFIFMELDKFGVISCTYICSTMYPDKEVFDFICEYAHQRGFFFDIRMIQMYNALDDEGYQGYIKRMKEYPTLSIYANKMAFIRDKQKELDRQSSGA